MLTLIRNPAKLEAATRHAAFLRELGLPCEVLDRAACLRLEPSLAPIEDKIVAGSHALSDEGGDAHKFSQNMMELARGHGAQFRFGTEIKSIRTDGDRVTEIETTAGVIGGDSFVLALGADSRRIAGPLGIRLPIYPIKGCSVTIPVGDWKGAPTMPVRDAEQKIVITPLGDRLRVAGLAEIAGNDRSVDPRQVRRLLSELAIVYPTLEPGDRGQSWAGLRPMTPDGPPILGRSRYRNLFLNTGQGGLGWTLACGSGRAVADIVSGRTPEIDLDGLTIDRYRWGRRAPS